MAENKLTVFKNDDFGEVRTIEINGIPWFVGKDVASALGYSNPSKAIIDHVPDDDKRFEMMPVSDSQNGNLVKTALINESGLYGLILSSKLPSAKDFKHWVTSEVIPSIRKTGKYAMTPASYIEALESLVASLKENERLKAENALQSQAIADFQPVKRYVDKILSSKDTLTVTQIAADYGITATALNKILRDEGVQFKVNGQWILKKQYKGQNLTDSLTYLFEHTDGQAGSKIYTRWTQKGRLLIHEILDRRGIIPLMDRDNKQVDKSHGM